MLGTNRPTADPSAGGGGAAGMMQYSPHTQQQQQQQQQQQHFQFHSIDEMFEHLGVHQIRQVLDQTQYVGIIAHICRQGDF